MIVPGADNRTVPVRVRGRAAAGTHPIEFRVRAIGGEAQVREKSVFLVR